MGTVPPQECILSRIPTGGSGTMLDGTMPGSTTVGPLCTHATKWGSATFGHNPPSTRRACLTRHRPRAAWRAWRRRAPKWRRSANLICPPFARPVRRSCRRNRPARDWRPRATTSGPSPRCQTSPHGAAGMWSSRESFLVPQPPLQNHAPSGRRLPGLCAVASRQPPRAHAHPAPAAAPQHGLAPPLSPAAPPPAAHAHRG
mmetsp:Transcript_34056/g.102853  ORF Transcript_34056/g.102853 Transcript_34056/m.102853 type:complete len:201 (-) Transcript_34056:385-987(-)